MSDINLTLALMTEGWKTYHTQLSAALAPLSNEQLALRAAPNLRSIDELARHIIAVRAGWFSYVLGEGDEAFRAFAHWNEPGNPVRSASELVEALASTWEVMQAALARYTPADLEVLVKDEDNGEIVWLKRGWVIWHVIEHDLHHGGEIGYSLGMHGLKALRI